jgi:hypothetical protein
MLRRWHRFPDRIRFEFGPDLFERPNAGRERIPVAVNDPVEFGDQGFGLLFGKGRVHDLEVRSLTNGRESARDG